MSLAKLIDKATDAELVQDNWQYNLDVCDKILEDPEEHTQQAIDLLKEKLNLKDGNVLLRALSLVVAIGENCGSRAQQLIATRSFTGVLLGKVRDPQTHQGIKTKIASVLQQLNDSFQRDPSLKPIGDAYQDVRLSFPQYLAPSKPAKRELSDEDADLRTAIELSLRDQPQPAPAQQSAHQQIEAQQTAIQPVEEEEHQRSFSRVRALYDSFSADSADLKFHKGDIITVIERVYKDWGKGSLRGVVGLFPFNYVTPLYDPTPGELAQERKQEALIVQRSKDVEKLLMLLTRSTEEESLALTQSDEFKELYQNVVLIKPELATLIDKYRQRKDDLMDMYGKLKTATASYEEMTDPMKFQGANPQYQARQPAVPQGQYPQYPQAPQASQAPSHPPQHPKQPKPEYAPQYQTYATPYPQ